MKKKLAHSCCLLVFCTELMAQTPHFKALSLGEAYPKARAEVMYEDRNSLLWFGSTQSLFYFDGLEFTVFPKSDSTGSEHVRAIFQDKKMRLWVGYEDGSIYYLAGQKLLPWLPEEGTPKVPVTDFGEDKQGRLWFSTYGEGVYYHDGVRLHNFNAADGLPATDIYVMATGPDGRMWLGTDGGISICSVQDGKKRVENLTREDGLPDEIVHEILPDSDGNMWIGTYDQGACLYNTKERRFEYPLEGWQHGIVNRLELFKRKELWIGTEGNGLWRFSLQDGSLRPVSGENFDRAKIYDLHKDIEGNIWAVSNTGGISYANRQFEFIFTDFKGIQAVLSDRQNRLWVGTPEGLFEYRTDERDNSSFRPLLQKLGLNVVSLHEDTFGNLWLGTFEKGVFCFDPATGKIRQFTEKEGLTNNNVLSIDGTNGHIWLATLGGVSEIEIAANLISGGVPVIRNFNEKDGLGNNFIYKVFIDSKKRTWFGTDGQGISVLENGQIRNYADFRTAGEEQEKPEESGRKVVYSFTEDHRGHIWFSTAADGIFEFDGEKFQHLTVKEGIRDLAITSLMTDANGKIVVLHPTGIDLLTPETHHLIYYDEEIGLHDLDPNLNATCKDRWGNIWMGVRNGIIKFSPLNEALAFDPRTRLNNVSILFKPVDFQSLSTFAHDQNNVVFEFMGLWYTDPASVKYRYRLNGYDPDWITTKDRHANYSSLLPGKYTFEVTSTENDAWLDEPVVSYSFEILPPVWRRWWFVMLCAAVAAGLFFWFQKSRDKRLQRVHLLEKGKAESELAALKAQINPHFLFNSFNTLIAVIEEDPPTAVEYVEKLSDFYRMVMHLRDKDVISIEEEVELVQHYGYLLQKRYGENFRLNVQLNGHSAFVVPLTLQILVENAVKHNIISSAKPLTVDIEMEGHNFVSVANNLQLKIHPEQSTGFGLDSLRRRYELLTGKKVKIEASKTQFKVSIPLIQ
ncbi:MAG: histidine kinase [Bacteroidetes bacterium]|nr:histidine kinase [Bacteroidota bacterium]